MSTGRPFRTYLYWSVALIVVTIVVLLAMGRVPVSKSGRILLWVAHSNSAENSQQIVDWYSFSHLIHGFAFYFLFYLIARYTPWNLSLGARLLGALVIECGWEVIENTPFVINRYRDTTASLDYYGDSVLNSTCDILFCAAGFALARRLPAWASVVLIVGMEVGVAYAIRDNLTLNILMLLYPIDAIRRWQTRQI